MVGFPKSSHIMYEVAILLMIFLIDILCSCYEDTIVSYNDKRCMYMLVMQYWGDITLSTSGDSIK